MQKFKLFVLITIAITLNACALGPLVSQESARTVGENNHELLGGYGNVGYVVKWNYGLTNDIDLGLQLESLSVGVRAKYAFLNNERGFSFAAAGGIGSSIGGSHYYGDLLASYKAGWWEPYTTLRWVHVKNNPIDVRDKDNNGPLNFTIGSIEYNYGQIFLGSRFWLDPHWLLSLEGSTFFVHSTGVDFSSVVLISAAFGYRF